MADVQTRAARVGEHVEDVILGRQLGGGRGLALQLMPHREGMALRQLFAGVPGAKGLLPVPGGLPFGLDQVKRILSAADCHRFAILGECGSRGNVEKKVGWPGLFLLLICALSVEITGWGATGCGVGIVAFRRNGLNFHGLLPLAIASSFFTPTFGPFQSVSVRFGPLI